MKIVIDLSKVAKFLIKVVITALIMLVFSLCALFLATLWQIQYLGKLDSSKDFISFALSYILLLGFLLPIIVNALSILYDSIDGLW
jgi:hypothetical protein